MSPSTALVVIIAILAFTAIRIARYRSGHDRHRVTRSPVDDAAKAQLTHEVEELRERVRVLERIATDTNSTNAAETRQIAEQIEALRDRQS